MKIRKLNTLLRRVFPRHEPYAFAVNYLAEREADPRALVDVGFWIHSLPRLILRCRLLGHRPVVDGCRPLSRTDRASHLWVRCGRCGERGSPQGELDPDTYRIGQRYHGPWETRSPTEMDRMFRAWKRGDQPRPQRQLPGRISRHLTGKVGGQLTLGQAFPGWGWEVKIGNRFSEHTLAASVKLGRLGSLYLHTEGFGMGLVTLLNGWADTSKLTGIRIGDGLVELQLWANRWKGYEPDISQAWWRRIELDMRLLDKLLGPRLYQYTDVAVNDGEPVNRVVRMPERDYLVLLRLQQVEHRRRRQWWAPKPAWSVDWRATAAGIPTKPGGGEIVGGGVSVPDRAVRAGTWPAHAAAAIALDLVQRRTARGFDPIGKLLLDRAKERV